MCDPVVPLCRDVAALLRREGLDGQAEALDLALDAAIPPGPSTTPDAGSNPVAVAAGQVAAAYLPGALSTAHTGAAGLLGDKIDAMVPDLHWTQTAAYVTAPPHDSFLGLYAHASVLGSAAASPVLVDPTHTAALGILILGPSNHYPHHRHPADEVYIPMTDALWSSGLDEPYQALAPGRTKHHRPGQAHAIRTEGTTLLTIYLWTGDTLTSAQLC